MSPESQLSLINLEAATFLTLGNMPFIPLLAGWNLTDGVVSGSTQGPRVLLLLPQNGVKPAYKMESPWQRASWKTVRQYGRPDVSSVISTLLTSLSFLKLMLPAPGPLHML